MGKKVDKISKTSMMNTVHWVSTEIKRKGKTKAVEYMTSQGIAVKTCAPNPDKFQILYQNRIHTLRRKKFPSYSVFKSKCKCLFSFKKGYGDGNIEAYVFDVSSLYKTIKTLVMYKVSTSRDENEYKFISSESDVSKNCK